MGSGDKGLTGLYRGGRTSKTSRVIHALGDLDEAIAALGVARAALPPGNAQTGDILACCQSALGNCAAEIAAGDSRRATDFDFAEATAIVEGLIAKIQHTSGEPAGFIIPGASPFEAALSMARAVVRRAERSVFAVDWGGKPHLEEAAAYVNRLSDLLFALVVAEGESDDD